MSKLVWWIIYMILSFGIGIAGYLLSEDNKIEYGMLGVILGLVLSLTISAVKK